MHQTVGEVVFVACPFWSRLIVLQTLLLRAALSVTCSCLPSCWVVRVELQHCYQNASELQLIFFLIHSRQGFGRQHSKSPNPTQQAERGHAQQSPPPTYQGNPNNGLASPSPVPPSPGLSSSMSVAETSGSQSPSGRRPPYFFREEYSGLIVKGNFMTLAAKPVHVDEGEWLAHQS